MTRAAAGCLKLLLVLALIAGGTLYVAFRFELRCVESHVETITRCVERYGSTCHAWGEPRPEQVCTRREWHRVP